VPIVFRGNSGIAGNLGATHSHRPEALYAHIPGLTVMMPSTPSDAKGMLKSAIRSDDPVIFIEHENLLGDRGEVSDDPEFLIPIGQADIKREGKDVTVLTYSRSVLTSLKAAEKMAEDEGIDAEVIDLRTIRPLDMDTVLASIHKTNRAVFVEENWPYCGLGAGVADRIYRAAFDDLDAPILRVFTKDAPVPYNKAMEQSMLPSVERVIEAVRNVMYR
jgi:pyruvate dehydrogenase E1 component beta subunit